MFDQWDELQKLHDSLNQELTSESLDSSRRVKVQKKLSLITDVLAKKAEITTCREMIRSAKVQLEYYALTKETPYIAFLESPDNKKHNVKTQRK